MLRFVLIGLGGSLGAIGRYVVSVWIAERAGTIFPYGTLLVNVAGSFVLGFLYEIFETTAVSPLYRSFLAVGFLGAFTTFSTFSLETLNLLRDGELRSALLSIGFNFAGGIAAVFFGVLAARILLRISG